MCPYHYNLMDKITDLCTRHTELFPNSVLLCNNSPITTASWIKSQILCTRHTELFPNSVLNFPITTASWIKSQILCMRHTELFPTRCYSTINTFKNVLFSTSQSGFLSSSIFFEICSYLTISSSMYF